MSEDEDDVSLEVDADQQVDISFDDGPEDDMNDDHVEEEYEQPGHFQGFDFNDEEEDHLAHIDAVIAKTKTIMEQKLANPAAYFDALFGVEYVEENLTDTFDDTPWLPPSTGTINVEFICQI